MEPLLVYKLHREKKKDNNQNKCQSVSHTEGPQINIFIMNEINIFLFKPSLIFTSSCVFPFVYKKKNTKTDGSPACMNAMGRICKFVYKHLSGLIQTSVSFAVLLGFLLVAQRTVQVCVRSLKLWINLWIHSFSPYQNKYERIWYLMLFGSYKVQNSPTRTLELAY